MSEARVIAQAFTAAADGYLNASRPDGMTSIDTIRHMQAMARAFREIGRVFREIADAQDVAGGPTGGR